MAEIRTPSVSLRKTKKGILVIMRHKSVAALLLVYCYFSLACSFQPTSRPSSADVSSSDEWEAYFPLSEGGRWEYSIEFSLENSDVKKGRAVMKIDGQEVINGQKYYKYITTYFGLPGPQGDVSYYRSAKEGIYKIESTKKDAPELLITPFPIALDSTWTVIKPEGSTHYRVEGVESVELPDQKYENCLKISYEWDTKNSSERGYLKGISYRARGIGEIKSTAVYKGKESYTLTFTLGSYKL
jgi:hypothetical protein